MTYTLEQILLAVLAARTAEDAYHRGLLTDTYMQHPQWKVLVRATREQSWAYERQLLATFGTTPDRYLRVGDLLRDVYLAMYGPGTPDHPYTVPDIPKEIP